MVRRAVARAAPHFFFFSAARAPPTPAPRGHHLPHSLARTRSLPRFRTCGVFEGEEYVGQWRDDAMHGEGRLRKKNGDVYTGHFSKNLLHGHGKFEWKSNGTVYEGGWKHDKRHGMGRFRWTADAKPAKSAKGSKSSARQRNQPGDYYAGFWENNVRNGWGWYYYCERPAVSSSSAPSSSASESSAATTTRSESAAAAAAAAAAAEPKFSLALLLFKHNAMRKEFFGLRGENGVKGRVKLLEEDEDWAITKAEGRRLLNELVWERVPPLLEGEAEAAIQFAKDAAKAKAKEQEQRGAKASAKASAKLSAKLSAKASKASAKAEAAGGASESKRARGTFSFIYRYILRESCSQFDSLPLTSLTITPRRYGFGEEARPALPRARRLQGVPVRCVVVRVRAFARARGEESGAGCCRAALALALARGGLRPRSAAEEAADRRCCGGTRCARARNRRGAQRGALAPPHRVAHVAPPGTPPNGCHVARAARRRLARGVQRCASRRCFRAATRTVELEPQDRGARPLPRVTAQLPSPCAIVSQRPRDGAAPPRRRGDCDCLD